MSLRISLTLFSIFWGKVPRYRLGQARIEHVSLLGLAQVRLDSIRIWLDKY